METIFPKREHIHRKKFLVKLSDMVKNIREDTSNVPSRKGGKSTEESFEMTLFLKTHAFQHILENPIISIIKTLKSLEASNKYHELLAFKLMAIVMFHGGEIVKREFMQMTSLIMRRLRI